MSDEVSETEHGVERSSPSEAFSALSDPLRVDILRELSAQQRQSGGTTLGFAELRKRVEVEDSGRFRYHLKQLQGTFVEKRDAGYRLTNAGLEVVAAILAGTYTDDQSLGPVELDSTCPECGQPAVAMYDDRRCTVTCAEDHVLFTWNLPPNATIGSTLAEVIDLAEVLAFQAVEQALVGVCPKCYDPITAQIRTSDASRPVFATACDSCGARIVGPIDFCLFVHPEVAGFCQRHGHSFHDNHVWESPFHSDESEITVVNDDPARYEFLLTLDGESLSGEINDDGRVTVNRTISDER